MRRMKSLAVIIAAFLATSTLFAAAQDEAKANDGYKLEEGTVLEFETSATFTSMRDSGSESWQHKASYTVLAARDGEYDLFVKITPLGDAQRRLRNYACDTVQISSDGKVLKQGQLLPSAIFPGWSVNYELPVIMKDGESVDYRDPVTMLPLQAKVTHTKKEGAVVQTIVADAKSKVFEQLPIKLKALEVENHISESDGLPVGTKARFAAELQVSEDGQKREVVVASESKRSKKTTVPKEALAKLKEDVALGATTFKALREATAKEDIDTTAVSDAIEGYLAKFPEGEFAPLLKELRTRVVSALERAKNWAAIREGSPAPQFSTKAIDGSEVDLQKLRGKVVVLDFWATWCGPCRQLVPKMKELYDTFKSKDFAMIGFSADQTVDDLKEYVEKEEIGWPQVFEGDGATTTVLFKYGVSKFPTVVVVDKEGIIRGVDVHPPELNELVEKLTKK
ncbi:MAG: TlpA family protein disulfide reductase [Candidatus Sumerlaeaceae bacterium]|nr:TlpA family protein disulfide reductase [Candidatus Sumerlaeaceae bacterium]